MMREGEEIDCNKRPLVSSISDLEEGLIKSVGGGDNKII